MIDPKVTLMQTGLLKLGFDLPKYGADGIWGKESEKAYQEYLKYIAYAPEWPKDKSIELNKFFGYPDFQKGVAPNLVTLEVPYPMYLAWDKGTEITRFSCNAKVHDSLKIILQRILEELGLPYIKKHGLDLYGGCVNVRKARFKEWYSRHSWGIAIDINPEQNGLDTPWEDGKQGQKGYATMPTAVIEIFEDQGWKSGARAWGKDAQHFQATQ